MQLKTILFFIFLSFLTIYGCKKNESQSQTNPQEKNIPEINAQNLSEDQKLRICLGPNYPEAVIFKKEYLKLINPQAAEYEFNNASNRYDIEIDLDKDGFKERAVTGLISLKPETEEEGKYKGFVAILRYTPDKCQPLFFREMDTGEINNMNLIVKDNLLMIALAANTGFSILIDYKNGKYHVIEENDEIDDDTLPEELRNQSNH